ncbi:hypothetical protein Amac_006850 [Acrocarpospora macrocephala]|uniref:DUF6917 domain-containing protein n=1 Tax=Acrocarpospora macrocephala TaxID=150177 RepID=A0A5M3WFP1_9ACTN|nr:hypothetical protein Amac_006850 [Acrocarpospora macrocephala]
MTPDAFARKAPVLGALVAVMDLALEGRELVLESYLTRVFRAGDVCELILSNDSDRGPGDRVPDATYLGFVRIDTAGLLVVGDRVLVRGAPVATLIGFDGTHLPNHYNVVLYSERPRTGVAAGFQVHDGVEFLPAVRPDQSEDGTS